jgi:formyltetrahydrofolate deformylase
MMKPANYILKLSCPDGPGIVHAVSGVLLAHQGNILSSAQHGDAEHQRFFMRIAFESPADLQSLRAAFAPWPPSGAWTGSWWMRPPRAAC